MTESAPVKDQNMFSALTGGAASKHPKKLADSAAAAVVVPGGCVCVEGTTGETVVVDGGCAPDAALPAATPEADETDASDGDVTADTLPATAGEARKRPSSWFSASSLNFLPGARTWVFPSSLQK